MNISDLPWGNNELNDLHNEIWIDALGYDGSYEVSSFGRVKSVGRFVNSRNCQRWVYERILKQSLAKDGRLSCKFSIEGIMYQPNVPALIYASFNPTHYYDTKKECVMHKNKLQADNRLSNLKIETISKSHELNAKKGLLPHLAINNAAKKERCENQTNKKCRICKENKNIDAFELNRKVCDKCLSKIRHDRYINKTKGTRRNCKAIIITDTITGEVFKSASKTSCIVSKHVINKYANTGKVFYPYNNTNKRYKNPLLIKLI